jgi:hypothetical protein
MQDPRSEVTGQSLPEKVTQIYNIAGWRAIVSASVNKFLFNDARKNARLHIRKLNNKRNITAAEVGVWKGEHAEILLNQLDIDTLYLIDPYEIYDDYSTQYSLEQEMLSAKETAHRRLAEYDNVVWIEEYSTDAVEQIDEPLDYAYLDANVDYEYYKRDIENFYELITEDGILAGHDFNGGSTDVVRAVEEFTRQKGTRFYVDSPDWFIHKRNSS